MLEGYLSQAAVEASDLVMVDRWEALQPEYQRSLSVLRSIKERLQKAMSVQPIAEAQPLQNQVSDLSYSSGSGSVMFLGTK